MDDRIGKIVDDLLGQGDREALFGSLGFRYPAKAASLWNRLLPEGPPPDASHPRALVEELIACPDRDMALLNLSRFADSTISPTSLLGSIYLEGPLCHLLVTILSCSNYLADILIRNPGYLAWLIEGGTLEGTKPYSSYAAELESQVAALTDPHRRLNSVKRY